MSATFLQRVDEVFGGQAGGAKLSHLLRDKFPHEGDALRWLYRLEVEYNGKLPPIADVIALVKRSSEEELWSIRIISQKRETFVPVEYRLK